MKHCQQIPQSSLTFVNHNLYFQCCLEFRERRFSWFRPFMITNFNANLLNFRDWFRLIGIRRRGWRVGVSTSLKFGRLLLFQSLYFNKRCWFLLCSQNEALCHSFILCLQSVTVFCPKWSLMIFVLLSLLPNFRAWTKWAFYNENSFWYLGRYCLSQLITTARL